jgi:hypothetical protein
MACNKLFASSTNIDSVSRLATQELMGEPGRAVRQPLLKLTEINRQERCASRFDRMRDVA